MNAHFGPIEHRAAACRFAAVFLCATAQPLTLPLVPSVFAVRAQSAAQAAGAPEAAGARQAAGAGRVRSAGRASRVGSAKATRKMRAAVTALRSENEAAVHDAIDALAGTGHTAAASALVAFIRAGQPDAIADHALEALATLASPVALPMLRELTRHRRPGARKRAYLALALIRDPEVPALVAQGLRDCDGAVRGASARALATLAATPWLDDLFRAFSQGVPEAAIAIGELGDAAAVERFMGEVGNQPLPYILAGCERFLNREDIPDNAKLQIVSKLGEASGDSVKPFLRSFLSSSALRDKPTLRRAVALTIRRLATGENANTQAPGASKPEAVIPRRGP